MVIFLCMIEEMETNEMLKIRLQGMPKEVAEMVESLKENYKVYQVSDQYPNRNSEYIRVYVELEEK
jgi:hypothetical protein